MKSKTLAVAVLTTLASVSVFAEEPSFNLIEGGYTDIEDADGFLVRGSVEITDNIYVTGSYTDVTEDGPGYEQSQGFLTFGAGLQQAISDTTVVYGEAEYLDFSYDTETDLGDSDGSEDGYQLSAGVRSMLAESTELYGELAHQTIDEEARTLASIGVRQYFTENLGVFAEVSSDDFDNTGYAVGVSFKF